MSGIDYKIQKYQNKLNGTNDQIKRSVYQKKINMYGGMVGGKYVRDEIKEQQAKADKESLKAPEPIDPAKYQLSFDPNSKITCLGLGAMSPGSVQPVIFERRAPRTTDVVFEVLFTGCCHSDEHTIRNEWKVTQYPVICGHEMTGRVIYVGAEAAAEFKKGDIVAMSPTVISCRTCTQCNEGFEQLCENQTSEAYNFPDRREEEIGKPVKPTAGLTRGGYSNIMSVHYKYLLKLPPGMPVDRSAPLLCAGITMYGAMKYLYDDKGKRLGQGHKVGIAGVGGLGSIGVKIAKALGAEVVGLTRTPWKLQDLPRLGASKGILMTDKEQIDANDSTLDFIINTIPFPHDLDPYVQLLKAKGTMCVVGSFFPMKTDFNDIIRKTRTIKGWNVAGIADCQELLNFCATNNILPDIELISAKQKNQTRERLVKSQVKYRFVIDMSTLKDK